jgi:4-hydroxybenzoate polyprenyltransferase
VLVLFLNTFTILLSFGGLALAVLYPFMKRYTHLPQVVLGAAFSWAIPMAFAAETNSLPAIAWLLYTANLLWTVAYDTEYAMVDRDDDLKIGVKSTAILFGEMDRLMIGMLQAMALFALWLLGRQLGFGGFWLAGLGVAAGLFVYQHWLMRERSRDGCFQAFLNNQWVGLAVFAGLLVDYLV